MWTLLTLPLLFAQDPVREALYDSLADVERVTDVVRVVEAVTPAVVYIQTESTVRRQDFFTGVREFQQHGGGTGVVIHEDGYIVTNYHVVKAWSDQITVSFAGDPTYRSTRPSWSPTSRRRTWHCCTFCPCARPARPRPAQCRIRGPRVASCWNAPHAPSPPYAWAPRRT